MGLPDCSEPPPVLELESWNRTDLISRVALFGEKGVDDFIREKMDEGGAVSERITQLRDYMRRRSERIMRAMEEKQTDRLEEFEERKRTLIQAAEEDYNEVLERRHHMQTDFASVISAELLDDDLIQLAIQVPRPKKKKLTLWQRFVAWLKRGWAKLMARLGRGKKAARGKRALLLHPAFGKIKGLVTSADSLLGNEMFDRRLEQWEDELAGWDRVRMRMKKRWSREGYKREVEKLFARKLEEKAKITENGLNRERRSMKKKLDELKKRREKLEKESAEEREGLEKRLRKEKDELKQELEAKPMERIKEEILETLQESGLVDLDSEGLSITHSLVSRFSDVVFQEELASVPISFQVFFGTAEESEGVYEKDKIRMTDEISRMDIVASVINARLRHPEEKHLYEEDLLINRERKASRTHVVIAFDRSGSMEENNRLLAAKRAVLALSKAVKERNPRNQVDVIAFDTDVDVTDLLGAWRTEPKGFTNTGEAIRTALSLFQGSRADKKLLYLITDGLPEAYTSEGRNYAGDLDKSLDYAMSWAREVGYRGDVQLTILLLEPEEEVYVEAADKICDLARGRMLVTDPGKLAGELLMEYAG